MRWTTSLRQIGLLLPWTVMAACNPPGPTQAELFELRTKCIAMKKAVGDEFAHYDATRNRCFTAHVEDVVGLSQEYVISIFDGQSRDVLMVCDFNLKEPQVSCEQVEQLGKSKKISRKEAEDFFKSRMGEDAPLFPDAKPDR